MVLITAPLQFLILRLRQTVRPNNKSQANTIPVPKDFAQGGHFYLSTLLLQAINGFLCLAVVSKDYREWCVVLYVFDTFFYMLICVSSFVVVFVHVHMFYITSYCRRSATCLRLDPLYALG